MSPGRRQNYTEVDLLRSNNKIEDAFNALSLGSDHKFPRVWLHLPDPLSLKWDPKSYPAQTQETMSTLEDFMKRVRS